MDSNKPAVRMPMDAVSLVKKISADDEQGIWVVSLDLRNRVLACKKVAKREREYPAFYAQDIIKSALLNEARAIVVVVRKSGDEIKPTEIFIDDAKNLWKAGRLLSIEVSDVIIAGDTDYHSMFSSHEF